MVPTYGYANIVPKGNIMKKVCLLLIVTMTITMLVACTNNNDTTNSATNYQNTYDETQNNTSKDEENNNTTTAEPKNKTHTEYVKTYTVYAEQGAVVTWFDSQTGQFKYKDKCETCGQVASGEHGGSLFVGEGFSYNAGFTCTNSNCSMWGKSQRAIIGCSVSGEWVEVND